MKKKIIALCLIIALALTAVTGATLAYFTDTDAETNTFAVGNVKIEQYEKDENDEDFTQGQKIYPIIDANKKYEDPNYVWKRVTVKNTGSEDAYVRTFIAIPTVDGNSEDNEAYNNWLHWNGSSASDDEAFYGELPYKNDWYWDTDLKNDWPGNGGAWNSFTATIDGNSYNVFVATHKSVVKSGEETGCNLRGFFLDSAVDCETVTEENDDGTTTTSLNYYYYPLNEDGTRSTEKINLGDISSLKILVFSQAVQAKGFVDKNNNGTAADEAFAASGLPTNPWATT